MQTLRVLAPIIFNSHLFRLSRLLTVLTPSSPPGLRPHTCGFLSGCFVRFRVGSRGSLPRWRPPLTHTNYFLGLGSQVCAKSARLWGFSFRVLAFSLCINRGSFRYIGLEVFAENLCPYDCNFLSVL